MTAVAIARRRHRVRHRHRHRSIVISKAFSFAEANSISEANSITQAFTIPKSTPTPEPTPTRSPHQLQQWGVCLLLQDKRERRLVRQQRLLARHPTLRISSLLRFQRFLCEGILRLWEAMLDQVCSRGSFVFNRWRGSEFRPSWQGPRCLQPLPFAMGRRLTGGGAALGGSANTVSGTGRGAGGPGDGEGPGRGAGQGLGPQGGGNQQLTAQEEEANRNGPPAGQGGGSGEATRWRVCERSWRGPGRGEVLVRRWR